MLEDGVWNVDAQTDLTPESRAALLALKRELEEMYARMQRPGSYAAAYRAFASREPVGVTLPKRGRV